MEQTVVLEKIEMTKGESNLVFNDISTNEVAAIVPLNSIEQEDLKDFNAIQNLIGTELKMKFNLIHNQITNLQLEYDIKDEQIKNDQASNGDEQTKRRPNYRSEDGIVDPEQVKDKIVEATTQVDLSENASLNAKVIAGDNLAIVPPTFGTQFKHDNLNAPEEFDEEESTHEEFGAIGDDFVERTDSKKTEAAPKGNTSEKSSDLDEDDEGFEEDEEEGVQIQNLQAMVKKS